MIRMCRRGRWAAQATRLCAELGRKGALVGRRYSVGTYRSQWAVLDLRGCPVVVAHDSFEAARWWHRLETSESVEGDLGDLPLVLDPDAEIAERERIERMYYHKWRLDFWLDGLRAREGRA